MYEESKLASKQDSKLKRTPPPPHTQKNGRVHLPDTHSYIPKEAELGRTSLKISVRN